MKNKKNKTKYQFTRKIAKAKEKSRKKPVVFNMQGGKIENCSAVSERYG